MSMHLPVLLMMRLPAVISILLACLFSAFPQVVSADYDSLSRISSKQLLDSGAHYFENREGSKALSCYLIVGDRYQTSVSDDEAIMSMKALNNAGCVYKYIYYDYTEAYDLFRRAYRLGQERGFDKLLPIVMVNMGDVLNDYGTIYKSDSLRLQAKTLFDEGFDKGKKDKNWELLITSFFNVSNLNFDINLNKYKAIFSREIPDSTPNLDYVRMLYRGIESMQHRDYAKARDYFEKQLSTAIPAVESERQIASAYINLSRAYGAENDRSNQLKMLEKALEISDSADMKEFSACIADELADCYKMIDDTANYLKYRQMYLVKIGELHNSRLSNIAELKYLNDLKEQEKLSRELRLKQRNQKFIILGVCLILLIVAGGTLLIWKKNRTLHASNKKLYEKYQNLLEDEGKSEENKYSHSNLDDIKRQQLLEKINSAMSEPANICSQEFTSKELARLVESNTTYVSQAINAQYGVSFSTLLGNYRVKEACRRINEDPSFSKLTIEGIANAVGFKSRTALINAFKREVGLTPSEYIKIASEDRRNRQR